MKILNKTHSELSKFIKESLNTKAFNFLTVLESRQELNDIIGPRQTTNLYNIAPLPVVKKIHDKVFGEGNNRIEIPINDPVPKEVHEHVKSQGDSITDTGHVKLKSGREVELSKYLPRSKAPKSVMDIHENWNRNRADQTTTKSKIAIERGPAILSGSNKHCTWTSCADPEWEDSSGEQRTGPAWKAMPNELKHGTLIITHLKHDAVPNADGEYNSKDKLGRKYAKRFDDNSYQSENKDYGKFPEIASNATNEFLRKNYPMKHGIAHKNPTVYNDDNTTTKIDPNISDRQIESYIKTGTEDDKQNLLNLPNLATHHVKSLSKDTNSNVADKAKIHQKYKEVVSNFTPEEIDDTIKHGNDNDKSNLVSFGKLSPQQLVTLGDMKTDSYNKSIRDAAINHENYPKVEVPENINNSKIDNIIKNGTTPEKLGLLKLKTLKPKHLSELIKDDHQTIRSNAIKHENVDENVIGEAISGKHRDIVWPAIDHKNATIKNLESVPESKSPIYKRLMMQARERILNKSN